MNQTNHFFDLGYGWLCKHCSAEDADWRQHHKEGAGRQQEMQHHPSLALARWTDASRRVLECPRCGIEEMVNKA